MANVGSIPFHLTLFLGGVHTTASSTNENKEAREGADVVFGACDCLPGVILS